MTAKRSAGLEFDRQQADLFSSVGNSGSGQARYSAAMYFYNNGLCSTELLEIYRRCCKFDNEDPIELARHEGIKPISKTDLETIRDGMQ